MEGRKFRISANQKIGFWRCGKFFTDEGVEYVIGEEEGMLTEEEIIIIMNEKMLSVTEVIDVPKKVIPRKRVSKK